MKNEKRLGILLSYVLVVVEAVSGLLFTKVLLKHLGQSDYGLYKLAVSWMSMISVLDFGLGSTITRYVIKYKTQGDVKGQKQFMGMAFLVYGILAAAVFVIGLVLCFILPLISGSLSSSDIPVFRIVFLLLVGKTGLVLFNHAYSGYFMAYERFIFIKSMSIVSIALRLILVFVLLPFANSAITVAGAELLVTAIQLLCNVLVRKRFDLPSVRFSGWNGELFKEIFVFTSAIFTASVINQFNGNVDSIVLGIFSTTACVGLYASVMQIYSVYSSLSTAIQGVFLPQVSKTVFENRSDEEITRSIIKPSRMQAMILFLALTGFILFGEQFLGLWIGDAYEGAMIRDGYIVGLIVMTSATWQLFQNSASNILKAKKLLGGKVVITGISTAANFVLTLLLVPHYGMIGAAIGTAVSMVFGYGIATNLYYKYVAGIKLKLYYGQVFSKIWLSIPVAFAIGVCIRLIPISGMTGFFLKAGLYCVTYILCLLFLGMTSPERAGIMSRKKKQ